MAAYPLRNRRQVTLGAALSALLEHTETRVRDGTRSPGTLTMQAGHVAWLERNLGAGTPLEALDERALDELAARARTSGGQGGRALSPKTVAKLISTLRRAFKLAARRREIQRMPLFPEFPQPPTKPAEGYFRSVGDYERVRALLPQHRRDWADVALWTGQHAADVERMTWADVDVDAAVPWVLIRNSKNRRPHGLRVKCPSPLLRALREMRDRARAERGRLPLPTDRIVRPWPTRAYQLGRACIRAGLPPINATGLRHTSVTWMVARTGLTPAAQRWYGWKSFAMMEATYVHALPAQLADAADELGNAAEPRKGPKRR